MFNITKMAHFVVNKYNHKPWKLSSTANSWIATCCREYSSKWNSLLTNGNSFYFSYCRRYFDLLNLEYLTQYQCHSQGLHTGSLHRLWAVERIEKTFLGKIVVIGIIIKAMLWKFFIWNRSINFFFFAFTRWRIYLHWVFNSFQG